MRRRGGHGEELKPPRSPRLHVSMSPCLRVSVSPREAFNADSCSKEQSSDRRRTHNGSIVRNLPSAQVPRYARDDGRYDASASDSLPQPKQTRSSSRRDFTSAWPLAISASV